MYLDSSRNIYIADSGNHIIRMVSADSKIITTVAGTPTQYRLAGDNGPATSAYLYSPQSVWVSTVGVIYIADGSNHRIRVVTNGVITTFAGMGNQACALYTCGLGGTPTNNTAATSTYFSNPRGVAGDTNGVIYIADTGNQIVRRVKNGTITTIAGTGIGGKWWCCISDGVPATTVDLLSPVGLFVTSDGSIYIADSGSVKVRRVLPNGILLHVAGSNDYGVSGDGGPASSAALWSPVGVWVTTDDTVYIADMFNNRIRAVDPNTKQISTIAGKEIVGAYGYGFGPFPATSAVFCTPRGSFYSNMSNSLIVMDNEGPYVRKISLATNIVVSIVGGTTFADNVLGTSTSVRGFFVTGDTLGNLYYSENHYLRRIDYSTGIVNTIAGTGIGTYNGENVVATSATVSNPQGLYYESTGVLYYADRNNNRIRKIASGYVNTIAGTGTYGSPVDGAAATSSNLEYIYGITGDGKGSIYFAETDYKKVRVIDSNGIISTFAGTGSAGYLPTDEGISATSASVSPLGIWMDSVGNMFITETTHRVRKVDANTRIITSLAGNGFARLSGDGGPATDAGINRPWGISGDLNGNIYVAESSNHRVRKIAKTSNIISTFAGFRTSGNVGIFTENDLCSNTFLSQPFSVVVDSSGNIYISDSNRAINSCIQTYPTSQPSSQPSTQPISKPTRQPTSQPSGQPTLQPVQHPTSDPSGQPSSQPSQQPRQIPTSQPSKQPYLCPSSFPSQQPSMQPSKQPIGRPSMQPSGQPTAQPTAQPNSRPSSQPTSQPSDIPSKQPSSQPTRQPSRFPSTQPTDQPTQRPTSKPSIRPTGQPSYIPTVQPSEQPVSQPSARPSNHPSSQPTNQPTTCPSQQPYGVPSSKPSTQPTIQPVCIPTTQPSRQPSCQPSDQPSMTPTTQPTIQPFGTPTNHPSPQPTIQPSSCPSRQPTTEPTCQPVSRPSSLPTNNPSCQPSNMPSSSPSKTPTTHPSAQPTHIPSSSPSNQPSISPTAQPLSLPSSQPSKFPSVQPSSQPTIQPSDAPTKQPFANPSSRPSKAPSNRPNSHPSCGPTSYPSGQPSGNPTTVPSITPSVQPTEIPTNHPSTFPSTVPSTHPSNLPPVIPTIQPFQTPSGKPSAIPSASPWIQPLLHPSSHPTTVPSSHPSVSPTYTPSSQPTANPTKLPSSQPSILPTSAPSRCPSSFPSSKPSTVPSSYPLAHPTHTPSTKPTSLPQSTPSSKPVVQPTCFPSRIPTNLPTRKPSCYPTSQPFSIPSSQPSSQPSWLPTNNPSLRPFPQPSSLPSIAPSTQPTHKPSMQPSHQPTVQPSNLPSIQPSQHPSSQPSCQPKSHPSNQPTVKPSGKPSQQPHSQPSVYPSSQPTRQPTKQPFTKPTGQPSVYPSSQPTRQPTKQPFTNPTGQPSAQPRNIPTIQPTSQPSGQPQYGVSHRPTELPNSVSPTIFLTAPPTHLIGQIAITDAYYSNDGSNVILRVNLPVQTELMSSIFFCNKVFIFAMASSARCSFQNSQTMTSSDVKYFTLNQTIGLNPFLSVPILCTATDRCTLLKIDKRNVTLQSGSNPISPVVVVKAPSMVGRCEDLQIDLTSSAGNAGRDWKYQGVFLTAGSDISDESKKLFEDQLVIQLSTTKPIAINRKLLTSSLYPYQIAFRLCNMFDRCGYTMVEVNITDSSDIAPTLEVAGATDRVMTRSVSLSLAIVASITQCPSDLSDTSTKVSGANLGIVWKISDATNGTLVPQSWMKSTSKDKMKFILPPYTLQSNRIYLVEVSATDPYSGLQNSKIVGIKVQPSALIAVITPRNMVTIRSGATPTVLDATTSYDPDAPIGNLTDFDITWQCLGVNPSYLLSRNNLATNSELLDNFKQDSNIFVDCYLDWNQNNSQPAKISVSSYNESAIDSLSIVILKISDKGRTDSRNSMAIIQVKVISGDAPLVSISTSAESLLKVNVKNRIFITGTISTTISCKALWSINDFSVDLSKISLSPITKIVAAKSQIVLSLVLVSNALPLIEATYQFSLSCGISSTSIVVTTNAAPSGGNYLIQPSQGEELNTVFTMSASQWMDSDLPLTYQFGYRTVDGTNVFDFILRTRMELNYATSSLPAGQVLTKHWLNTTVNIYDSFGASEMATAAVQVIQIKAEDLANTLVTKLQNVLVTPTTEAGSTAGEIITVDELKQLLTISSSAINRLNCTNAPDCSSINRYSCSTKDNTCGKCLPGFIGEEGSSNSYCISTQIAAISVSSSSKNSTCTKNTDCQAWEYCNLLNATCTDMPKLCPLDCSGHGSCSYYSSTTGRPLPQSSRCTIFMGSCEGRCQCEGGYAGSDCAMTDVQLQAKQQLREALVIGLAQTMQSDTLDSSSILGTASTLQSIMAKSDEVSTESALQASSIAKELVKQATELGDMTFNDLISIPATIDAAITSIKATASVNSTADTKINLVFSSSFETIDNIGDLAFQDQIPNGNANAFIQTNFRFISQCATQIKLPLTPLEQLNNNSASTVISSVSPDKKHTTLRVHTKSSIIETFAEDDNGEQLQQLQAVEFNNHNWKPANNSETVQSNIMLVKSWNVDTVQITINKIENSDLSEHITNITTICTNDDFGSYSFLCPDSGVVLIHSCNGTAGTYVSYCPIKVIGCSVLSIKKQLVVGGNSIDTCTAVNETATSVICRCKIPQKAISSTVSSSSSTWTTGIDVIDQSGALTMALMAYYVATDFKNTFNAAPSALSSYKDTEKVILVILMFVLMWTLGFLIVGLITLQQFIKQQHKFDQLPKLSRLKRVGKVETDGTKLIHINRHSSHHSLIMKDKMKAKLMEYVKSVMPGVFNSSYILVAIQNEMQKHHIYLKLFYHTTNTRTPILVVIQILTNFSALMFLLALLYDLQSPTNDGSCSKHITENECTSTTSFLDDNQAYCQWIYDQQTDQYSCTYNPIEINIKIRLYCTIIVSLFTSVFMHPVDLLFTILSSPTKGTINSATVSDAATADKVGSIIVLPEETRAAYRKARLATMSVTNEVVKNDKNRSNKVVAGGLFHTQRKHSRISSMTDSRFHSLIKDIKFTRHVLLSQPNLVAALHNFDVAWGIDSISGEFINDLNNQNISIDSNFTNKFISTGTPVVSSHPIIENDQIDDNSIEKKIIEELEVVSMKTSYYKAELDKLPDDQAGVELLQLFIQDLLGRDTAAAKIFRTKTSEDYATLPVVGLLTKTIAGVVLVAINFFFMYYSILRGYQKGLAWQQAFLIGCILQLIMEIFFSETLQCLYVHYFVPRMMSKTAIDRIHNTLQLCIDSLCNQHSVGSGSHNSSDEGNIVDAPNYLFVSTKLAHEFPAMMESLMILSYHSTLPGEIGKKWHARNIPDDRKFQEHKIYGYIGEVMRKLWTSASTIYLLILMNFIATAPLPVQKMVIRLMEPIILGGMAFIWLFISQTWFGIFLFSVFCLIICIGVVYRYVRAVQNEQTVTPTAETTEPVDDIDLLQKIAYNQRIGDSIGISPVVQPIVCGDEVMPSNPNIIHAVIYNKIEEKGEGHHRGVNVAICRIEDKVPEIVDLGLGDKKRTGNDQNPEDANKDSYSHVEKEETEEHKGIGVNQGDDIYFHSVETRFDGHEEGQQIEIVKLSAENLAPLNQGCIAKVQNVGEVESTRAPEEATSQLKAIEIDNPVMKTQSKKYLDTLSPENDEHQKCSTHMIEGATWVEKTGIGIETQEEQEPERLCKVDTTAGLEEDEIAATEQNVIMEEDNTDLQSRGNIAIENEEMEEESHDLDSLCSSTFEILHFQNVFGIFAEDDDDDDIDIGLNFNDLFYQRQ